MLKKSLCLWQTFYEKQIETAATSKIKNLEDEKPKDLQRQAQEKQTFDF